MDYKITYKNSVLKDLKKLPRFLVERTVDIIENILSQKPYSGLALKGKYQGLYRYRAGNYRVIYHINKEKHEVCHWAVENRPVVGGSKPATWIKK